MSLGWLLAFAVTLLVFLFLGVLPRFGGNLRALGYWRLAFLGLSVHLLPFFVQGLQAFELIGECSETTLDGLGLLLGAGGMLFLTAVALAAIQSAGRVVARGVAVGALTGGTLLGLIAFRLGVSAYLLTFATLGLLFGPVQMVLAKARGDRRSGLRALAFSMTFLVVVFAIFAAWEIRMTMPPRGSILGLLVQLRPYFHALAILILGAGVAMFAIQDAILEVAVAREESLRVVGASEARLKQIIGAAGEAIITFAGGGRIELANEAAARLFRLPVDELIGRQLADLVVLDEGDLQDAVGMASGQVEPGVGLSGRGRRPDDADFPIELTVGALSTEGSPAGGGVAILRDQSQRLTAEAERERFERRLAESEKMLAIGRVVSGVAHELNNPLAVVLGQSEQLALEDGPARVQEGLRLINEQARRARHIVRDLLAFVRQREEQREPVNLSELVHRVVLTQRAEAELRDVTLEASVEETSLVALADRLAVEQVLINLVDNALDAVARNGSVRLRAERHGASALLIVEDDGPGIDEELLDRVFEPFFTTKPVGEGTGLGLAVSASLLERMGGSLRLHNRPLPGIGARFTVQLPIGEVPQGCDSHPEPSVERPSGRPNGGIGRVLVIDDEPSVRSTITQIFKRWGWQVKETGDADAALVLLDVEEGSCPDLILCDLRMPGMTGEAFFEALGRAGSPCCDRVVFVTGDVVEPSTAEFLHRAGRPVVEKPFTLSELARVAERFSPPA